MDSKDFDGDVLHILNDNNIYITEDFIQDILKKYDIHINIKTLENFQIAMTHSSYLKRNLKSDSRFQKIIKEKNMVPLQMEIADRVMPLADKSYERLEFIGDSIIHNILAIYLYQRFPNQDEGFMTILRTKIESGNSLANLSRALNLDKYLVIARHIDLLLVRQNNTSILEDIFEAFIGALFIETLSFDVCEKLIVKLIEDEIDISELIYHDENYKNILMCFYHTQKWPEPTYNTVIDKEGIECTFVKGYEKNEHGDLEWVNVAKASGTSKRKSEQAAAHLALIKYNIIKYNNEACEEIYYKDDLSYD